MLQRWKMSHNNSMVTEPDGEWVEYKDHLAAIEEQDKEIERLRKALQLIASEGGKSRETECGIIQCNGAWCADQAYWAIQEDSDATSSRSPDPK